MATRPEEKDTALPLGEWMIVHFREPIGKAWSVEGNVAYCATYGVRIVSADGAMTFIPHSNILGATGEEAR